MKRNQGGLYKDHIRLSSVVSGYYTGTDGYAVVRMMFMLLFLDFVFRCW